MKDNGSDDDDRNGKDSAPQPFIRIEAKRKYPQAYRESDLGKDQSHRLTVLGARP